MNCLSGFQMSAVGTYRVAWGSVLGDRRGWERGESPARELYLPGVCESGSGIGIYRGRSGKGYIEWFPGGMPFFAAGLLCTEGLNCDRNA